MCGIIGYTGTRLAAPLLVEGLRRLEYRGYDSAAVALLDPARTPAMLLSRSEGKIAAIMHMEGAEAIGADLDALHVWHAAGLRSLGPVWSRPTVFGHGVPFRYPSSPDTGPGLTPAQQAQLFELLGRLKTTLPTSLPPSLPPQAGRPMAATQENSTSRC